MINSLASINWGWFFISIINHAIETLELDDFDDKFPNAQVGYSIFKQIITLAGLDDFTKDIRYFDIIFEEKLS